LRRQYGQWASIGAGHYPFLRHVSFLSAPAIETSIVMMSKGNCSLQNMLM
jgi:hypothetical protein